MKKVITLFVAAILATPVMASEQVIVDNGKPVAQSTNGGFQGPSRSKRILKDVISALNASDDTHVQLTGYLTMSLGDEDYIFQDSTGEITVEIDDDLWQGRTVTPDNQIRIYGEVEKDWDNVSIEVDYFEVM